MSKMGRFRNRADMKKPPKNAACSAPLQVFKMQRPLFDSQGMYTQIMIYNEDKSIESILNVDEDVIVQVFYHLDPEGDHKVFVLATTDNLGQLQVQSILGYEEWPEW